jgi:hypothetical protein
MKKRILLALSLSALMGMVAASSASATHVRPQAGVNFRVPLVIAYNQCVAGSPEANRTHGPSLTAPSCNPPVQSSQWLTVGTTDANGYAAQSVGFVKITVCPTGTTASGVCSTPAGMTAPDVRMEANITDVRCKVGGPTQSNCEGGALTDYIGGVQGTQTLRITDHHNSTTPGGTGETATVTDQPFPFGAQCSATGANSTTIGGTCNVLTRANAVVPGSIVANKRANIEVGQVKVFDGGQGGVTGAGDATLFEVQGIFIP